MKLAIHARYSSDNQRDLSIADQMSDGMSYGEVVNVLGAPGKELSRSSLMGTTTVMYSWEAPGFANMNAMFQNDRMISKAQFGLK